MNHCRFYLKLLIILVLSFVPVMGSFAYAEHQLSGKQGPADPNYQIRITYDHKKHQITGYLHVTFTNNLGKSLSDLYFLLWGNADVFRQQGGKIDVGQVMVNGKPAMKEVNGTALYLQGFQLEPDSTHHVDMPFTVKIPKGKDRFSWNGQTVSLGNWFPILAVYDQKGWNVNPYFSSGESFYSLTSDFEVSLTTDASQVIATTGIEKRKIKLSNQLVTHVYQAKNVRDFAIEMDSTYKVNTRMVDQIKVNVYYSPQHAKFADDMMKGAVESLQLFQEKFGPYPWPELDVVSMEGWFGGMEYPQLVMISLHDLSSPHWVRSVVAHEVGHQWFYGMVGNNQYDEPWLDESFANYAQALYDGELDLLQAEPIEDSRIHLTSPVSVYTAAGKQGEDMYYHMVYEYGARTLNDLRKELGDAPFYQAMKKYVQQKRLGISTTADFIHSMEASSGKDLTSFFQQHRVFISD